jgi:hypothetical protein
MSGPARAEGSSTPRAVELLQQGHGFFSRSHLRELGLERRAIDAIFRRLDVVAFPGYSRPLVRVEDYLRLLEESTYRDDRVRPIGKAPGAASTR